MLSAYYKSVDYLNNPCCPGLFGTSFIQPGKVKISKRIIFQFKIHIIFIPLFILFSLIKVSGQQRDLNFYLQSAFKNDLVINENTQMLSSYKLRRDIARTSVISPNIFTTANYLFAPTFKEIGYDSSVTNGGLYSALINFDLPLFRNSSLNVKLKNTDIEQNSFANIILTTKHDLEKNVTDKYIKAFLDLKQIENIKDILEILKTQRAVIMALSSNGLFKISDIKLFDIESQTLAINLIKQENTYKQDLYDLNLQSGINDSSIVTISEPNIQMKAEIGSSKYLFQFQIDSLSLIMEREQFELNFKPQLDFFINGGLNAVTYKDIQKKFGVSTGLNFTFSLYDGNQRALNGQLTEIKMDILTNKRENFLKQNKIRISNVVKEINDVDTLIKAQQMQVENYMTLLDLYQEELPAGEISVIDYINTLKNFVSFKSDLLTAHNQKLNFINEYNYWNW